MIYFIVYTQHFNENVQLFATEYRAYEYSCDSHISLMTTGPHWTSALKCNTI